MENQEKYTPTIHERINARQKMRNFRVLLHGHYPDNGFTDSVFEKLVHIQRTRQPQSWWWQTKWYELRFKDWMCKSVKTPRKVALANENMKRFGSRSTNQHEYFRENKNSISTATKYSLN